MAHKEYYEAIIQLRNPTLEVEEHLIKSLRREISNAEKVKNGVDYYITDQKKAKKVAKQIRDRFGGEFKVSPSLHTKDRQTSKEVYRLNILVRIPEFQKGDVIKIGDSVIRVTGLGKKISGDNLETGKKEVYEPPIEAEKLEKRETRVVQKKPSFKVLHPDTYQATSLVNEPDRELQVDEKIKVVVDKGLYIV